MAKAEDRENEKNSVIKSDLYNFQEEYIKLDKSSRDDTVGDLYQIHLGEHIEELSNEFCKYYHASHIENNSKFLALVYENDFAAPIWKIAKIFDVAPMFLNKIRAFSIVRLSNTNSEQLVVIVDDYDPRDTLANYIKQHKNITSNQAETIIKSVYQLIAELSDKGIYNCNISPQNIILKNGDFLFVREFFQELAYYSTPQQYLAPELIECLAITRETNSIKADIYSLGITIVESYLAKKPWSDFQSASEYNELRLEKDSYKYLLNKAKISERFRVFFKFTLHHDLQTRWGRNELGEWVSGKNIKYNKYDSITESNNLISFNDKNYSNLQSLSFALFYDWEKALRFIRDDKLYRWASREHLDNKIIEGIMEVVDLKSTSVVANTLNAHYKLTKLLSIIDPYGPIRQMGIGLTIQSVPAALHYLFSKNKRNECDGIIKVIKEDIYSLYTNPLSLGYLDPKLQNKFKQFASMINQSAAARGIERLIYSLNPNVRCGSKILDKFYVNNLDNLIVSLDKFAQEHPKKFTFDRHLVAFICAKLGLKDAIKPVIFQNFPKLSEHPVVVALSTMNVLQQHNPAIQIPNIVSVINAELKVLIDENFHNIEFKKQIVAKLDEAGKTESLDNIIKVLANQQQFVNDYNSFRDVCKQVKMIEERINLIQNSNGIQNAALLLGQKVTVLASYILCLVVTVTVII